MIFIIYGNDTFLVRETLKKLQNRYTDTADLMDFSLDTNIAIADFTSALVQQPMFSEYFTVLARMNRQQFIRLRDYIKTSPNTVFILKLDFNPSEEDLKNIKYSETIDCRTPYGRQLTTWIKSRLKARAISLDLDDVKVLGSLFSDLKQIDDVIYQLSLLDSFDRQKFLNSIFTSRQKFSWTLFINLVKGKKKAFFKELADSAAQNAELETYNFLTREIGGIIYTLNAWKNETAPEWVLSEVEQFNDKQDFLLCKFHTILMEAAIQAKEGRNVVNSLIYLDKLFS